MIVTIGAVGGTNVERLNSIYFQILRIQNRRDNVVTSPLLSGNVSGTRWSSLVHRFNYNLTRTKWSKPPECFFLETTHLPFRCEFGNHP
jgi:hypothetical protein